MCASIDGIQLSSSISDQVIKHRVEFIDVAKALAIIAVIADHTAIRFLGLGAGAQFIFALAFTFHLPVFFVTSGYFLHVDRRYDLAKEVRALVIPYMVSSILIVTFLCASNLFLHDMGSTTQLFKDWLSASVYGAGDVPSAELAVWPLRVRIGGTWFLLALFWARMIAVKLFKTKRPILLSILCFFLGLLSARVIFLPFDIQSGLCAVPFVILGTYANKSGWFTEKNGAEFVIPALFAVWLWAVVGFNGFSMAMCDYGRSVVDCVRNIVGAIASSLCLILFLALIEQGGYNSSKFWQTLSRLGSLTLYVLMIHVAEDDILRWGQIVEVVGARSQGLAWLGVLVVRILADVCIAVLLQRLIQFLMSKAQAVK